MYKKYQKIQKYFDKHSHFNAVVHLVTGIGIGIFITYPVIGAHPLRWALGFLAVGVLGHLYPLIAGK
jgi:hypothetical protein